MFTSETKIRIRYAETNKMDVVYHANFFYYYKSARAGSIRQPGFTYDEMEKMGVIMPVMEVQANFLTPAR